ncbi:MAG: MoaD/ThiS family protein [Pirellulales bacterium]
MQVTVKLFAVARELAGCNELELALADGATVGDLRRRLVEVEPRLAAVVAHAHVAVDSQYATDGTPIAPGNELALIPPVSGG